MSWFRLSGLACAVALSAIPSPPAGAIEFSVNAIACQNAPPARPEDFGHSPLGVFSAATAGSSAVVCPVMRLGSGATTDTATFTVHGDNLTATATTTCTLVSFDKDLQMRAIRSFITRGVQTPRYNVAVSLTSNELDPLGFIALSCTLPLNGAGILRGVTQS